MKNMQRRIKEADKLIKILNISLILYFNLKTILNCNIIIISKLNNVWKQGWRNTFWWCSFLVMISLPFSEKKYTWKGIFIILILRFLLLIIIFYLFKKKKISDKEVSCDISWIFYQSICIYYLDNPLKWKLHM